MRQHKAPLPINPQVEEMQNNDLKPSAELYKALGRKKDLSKVEEHKDGPNWVRLIPKGK